jgi:Ca-activated chloride channel family protein
MERMRWLDRPVVVTTVFAVLITAMAGALHQAATSRGCIQLVVVSSQEKALLMEQAATHFNTSPQAVVGGRCVHAIVEAVVSGAAEEALADDWTGQSVTRPDVWIPSANTWVNLLDGQRTANQKPSLIVPSSPPTSLMQSPLVIAMPASMANALGWPDSKIGWSTIFDLAQDPRGWARYRHPGWGAFRLGKTNPHLSTSGLNALINMYYAASGKKNSLTTSDLIRPVVKNFVQKVESSVAHYGDTATTFLTNLLDAQQHSSTPYVSAVAVEEKEVWNYNVGNLKGDPNQVGSVPPAELLDAFYPTDGTILADHPYTLLNWSTLSAEKKAASDQFLAYLLSPDSQVIFQNAGFRNRYGVGGSEISLAYGLNPDEGLTVPLPDGQVIAAIQKSWDTLRKPARVLIVIDASKSVGAARLALIKQPLADALNGLASSDQVGLWQAPGVTAPFDELVPVGPLAAAQSQIDAKIFAMTVSNREALLVDLVQGSVHELSRTYDPKRIDAVVLLSPGTGATPPEIETLLGMLRNQPPDRSIHIFTVSYGNAPDQNGTLLKIANASGGGFYDTASPGTFHDLMIQVLSNF